MGTMPDSVSFAPYEDSSPSLLSMQPVEIEADNTDAVDWLITFIALEARLAALRNWRYSWWSYWAQLAEYLLPRRYHWLITANLMRKGNPINQAIIDSTAGLAMQICAAGMVDGLMPQTREWFRFGIALPGIVPDAEAKMWLEDSQKRVETVLAQSNFYNIMAQASQDLVTFGTAPVIMYEDSQDVIRCYGPCAGEYYLAVSSRFTVDTLYREFTLTVLQIVDMFTLECCPEQVQKLWRAGGASLETEFVVAHAIEPNFAIAGKKGGDPITVVKGGFPFREVYWLRGIKTARPLSKRGFEEKPFAVARWSTVSNDAYGRGPGMDALGDIKQLQQETRRKAEAIEKQVRPPMGADMEMKNEPSSILPGHVTYTDTTNGKKGFWNLFDMKFDLADMTADLKEIQTRIDRCFLVDVFMAISQMEGVQPRNELEIAERKSEKLQRLGPTIGLWKTEYAGPQIERALAICRRKNMLKPLPKSLQGIPLKIDYIDMVTLAQQGVETAGMERVWAVAGRMSAAAKSAGVPDPIRILDLDKGFRIYGDKLNYPTEAVFTPDQVGEHDQERAKANAKQQVLPATMAGVSAAKTLSETDIGGGRNALSAMIGGGDGAAPA